MNVWTNQIDGAAIMSLGRIYRGNRLHLAAIMLVSVFIASAQGQTTSEGTPSSTPEGAPSSGGNVTDGTAAADPGRLDKLLEMADKNVGQLAQVKVAGQTGSPSLDLPVSSVSRQESTVGRSPAAVFVITNEMIRRSGAKEIPEVLHMVPGVDVAKIDSNKWAVSVRGFNGRFTNALLVRIDGRDVYTPLFGGTFWDVQDVLLEDVERIEVIRGPGATVWGANAVNGVINIITKNAKYARRLRRKRRRNVREGVCIGSLRRPGLRGSELSVLWQVVRSQFRLQSGRARV